MIKDTDNGKTHFADDETLAYIKRLEDAIQKTIEENGHLADGDNCTLIHLVRIMSAR